MVTYALHFEQVWTSVLAPSGIKGSFIDEMCELNLCVFVK